MRCDALALSLAATALTVGCSTRFPPPTVPDLTARTGVATRPADAHGTVLPPGVRLDDGLAQDEAVAIALWNNPDFQAGIAQLGFARADLLEAGLLRNPVLSLLFPIGPKQLEATLRFPIEVLWERPKRIAAARVAADAAAAGLEQSGLILVFNVKTAYIDLVVAQDRLQLAEQAASELAQIDQLTQSRLRAGDISELEARTATIEAARARQEAIRAAGDVSLRANALRRWLGLALDEITFSIASADAAIRVCASDAALLEDALASRPDVRAAELAVEAAGRRLGWEESRVLALSAVLDANGNGDEGFELGPGVEVGLPIFDRNRAGVQAADDRVAKAHEEQQAARLRALAALADAYGDLASAHDEATALAADVLPAARSAFDAVEEGYRLGRFGFLDVLDAQRTLVAAEARHVDALAAVHTGVANIERLTGMPLAVK